MKNLLLISISTLIAMLFSGCPNNKPNYNKGVFSKYPTNYAEVNSEYDDYNAALPVIQNDQYLYFSSNRNSAGHNFDIVGDNLHIWWDMETGLLMIQDLLTHYLI